jgi:uncharacterized membrane protein
MGERVERNWVMKWGAPLLALALIAAAIWFRCAWLLTEPLWLDEAYSAYAAGKSFDFLWHVVPLYETHPPFYYSLLRLWTLAFGDSLAGLRSLGIACGIATLPMMMLAARELARLLRFDRGRTVGLVLATLALAAFSTMLVEMSREVRPYPVLILVYAASLFALFRLGRRSRDGSGIGGGACLLYLLTLALTLWLHNLGPLYGLAIGIALLALVIRPGLDRRDWLWLVGGHAAVAGVYLPALRIMLDQAPGSAPPGSNSASRGCRPSWPRSMPCRARCRSRSRCCSRCSGYGRCCGSGAAGALALRCFQWRSCRRRFRSRSRCGSRPSSSCGR